MSPLASPAPEVSAQGSVGYIQNHGRDCCEHASNISRQMRSKRSRSRSRNRTRRRSSSRSKGRRRIRSRSGSARRSRRRVALALMLLLSRESAGRIDRRFRRRRKTWTSILRLAWEGNLSVLPESNYCLAYL